MSSVTLLVAVAVMNRPVGVALPVLNVKLALPLPSVVTVAAPIKSSPWPKPVASLAVLEKNSTLKEVLGVLLSVLAMVVSPPALVAEVSTG